MGTPITPKTLDISFFIDPSFNLNSENIKKNWANWDIAEIKRVKRAEMLKIYYIYIKQFHKSIT